MDSLSASGRIADRGVSSAQFVLASALAFLVFVALANLVVIQYGRGAVRSALEQGARAGSVSGMAGCQEISVSVIDDLLGGRMSDELHVVCELSGDVVTASASGRFETWTPLMPDYRFSLAATAVVEP